MTKDTITNCLHDAEHRLLVQLNDARLFNANSYDIVCENSAVSFA
jgi:hypothetical protein